ncbi:hypothetical protein D3C85_1013140 [compost metagenome]
MNAGKHLRDETVNGSSGKHSASVVHKGHQARECGSTKKKINWHLQEFEASSYSQDLGRRFTVRQCGQMRPHQRRTQNQDGNEAEAGYEQYVPQKQRNVLFRSICFGCQGSQGVAANKIGQGHNGAFRQTGKRHPV